LAILAISYKMRRNPTNVCQFLTF